MSGAKSTAGSSNGPYGDLSPTKAKALAAKDRGETTDQRNTTSSQ